MRTHQAFPAYRQRVSLLNAFVLSCLLYVQVCHARNYNNATAKVGGLSWNELSVQTSDGTFLLNPSSGYVAPGEVWGVLGPSGAGKTTFLSSLAGNIAKSSGLDVNGDIMYHGHVDRDLEEEQLQVGAGQVAWLQQKDEFFNMLTVRETLELAAFLELPHYTERQRQRRVQANLDSLGLRKLQHRRIGDSQNNNGLSGGEQRRLSLARELVAAPKVFIGDEPTSGLDSTLSEKVVKIIKKLVQQRKIPCLLSLHQPRSSIWRMLDSIILLAPNGRPCYIGPTGDAVEYFSNLGYKCPAETNPAEFLLDLVSIDSEDPYIASKDEERISKLAKEFHSHHLPTKDRHKVIIPADGKSNGNNKPKQYPLRFIPRFGRLVVRSWRQNIRNRRVNLLRLGTSVGNAILFSHIFKTIQKGFFTVNSVADRTAMLTFGIINMSMMALMKTIDLFAKEKPVVKREQQRNQYTSLEYLLSKVVAEIPLDVGFAAVFTSVLKFMTGVRIGWKELTATFSLMTASGASLGLAIGAMSPTAEIAMTAGVPILVILMTVGVINPSGVDLSKPPPKIVERLKSLSPIYYAVRAVCIAEYRGMEFVKDPSKKGGGLPKMGAFALVRNGQQVLEALGLGQETYLGVMKQLAILSAANLCISWLGLHLQAGPQEKQSNVCDLMNPSSSNCVSYL